VPIWGGDVYYAHDRELEPAYANWHVDLAAEESQDEFAVRANDIAWNYIVGFPARTGEVPVFVLVAAELRPSTGEE
jgi:hypothetical protein